MMRKITLAALGCAMLLCVGLVACNTQTQPVEHIHEWGEWTVTTAPTCTAEGEETRVCELDASHTETRSVAADPDAHEWGEWKETKAPTCTAEGEETRVCELDASHTETRSVAADPDAHEWGEWKETKAPTYVAEGEETRVCTHNEAHKQTRSLAKLEYITESITVEDGDRLTATHQADKTLQLHVKIKYVYDEAEKDATRADVAYTSGNHAVATVNADGEITIVAPGTAEITIESVYNNESGAKVRKTVQLTVNHAPITEMTLTSSQSYSLIRGLADEEQGVTSDATAQIVLTVTYLGGTAATATSADVTFVSGDNAVASVDANGLITFNGVGTTTITLTSKYEKQGGGYMEQEIAVEVKTPINNTGLEVTKFEVGQYQEYEGEYLIYTVKNVSDRAIRTRIVDVYYMDSTGKILGTGTLLLVSSLTPITMDINEEVERVDDPNLLPDGTAQIFIYNSRIDG